jgi:uncharacterized protein YprB with RNaseH-like and TPR domain
MALDELRRRMEMLNGGPLAVLPEPSAASPEAVLAVVESRQSPPTGGVHPLDSSLLVHVPGEPRTLSGGSVYYHVERCMSESGHLPMEAGLTTARIVQGASFRDNLRKPVSARPEETLFLDLETLGLYGEPLFLIGLLKLASDGRFTCLQLLARDLGEETAILLKAASYLRDCRLLVTFNGRSFDVPFLKSRFSSHGLRFPRTPTHVDVLIEARLRYSRRFRDCKLQTLEHHICGRRRIGDIPSAKIPSVYHKCIASRDARNLATILHHNLLDLATTAELFAHLWSDPQ